MNMSKEAISLSNHLYIKKTNVVSHTLASKHKDYWEYGFQNHNKYKGLYLSELSFIPSHGFIKSSFSNTNPETKISTASL